MYLEKLCESNFCNPSCHSVDPTLICLSTRGAEAHGGEPHHLWQYMGRLHCVLDPHGWGIWQLCHWGNKLGEYRREPEPLSFRRRFEPGHLRAESQHQLHGWPVWDVSGLLPWAPVHWSHHRYLLLAAFCRITLFLSFFPCFFLYLFSISVGICSIHRHILDPLLSHSQWCADTSLHETRTT